REAACAPQAEGARSHAAMSVFAASTALLQRFPYAVKAADHEGAHAAAAHHYGWKVDEIVLREDGGDCYFLPAEALDPLLEEYQRCVILLAGSAYSGDEGGFDDRVEVWRRTRAISSTLAEQEQLRKRVEYEAAQLVAGRRFRSVVGRVASALLERGGHLLAGELALILAGERARLALSPLSTIRASFPPVEEWSDEQHDRYEADVRRYSPRVWEAWVGEQAAVAEHER